MERNVFCMKKQSAVLGTCESAAFILSLRDGNEFCKTHSSGYHSIPHIGVYGESYAVCSPIALISLPATPGCLQELPSDLLGALDLFPLCGQTTKLAQATQTDPHRRVGISGIQTMMTGAFNYSVKEGEEVAKSEEEERLSNEPSSRHLLNPTWTAGNFDTVEEEEEEPEESGGCDASYGSISVVIHSVDGGDPSQTLKSLAKKIVMEALRKACKVLEASGCRSSIDYLTANAKRMKVGRSPSPLKEMREEESPSPLPMENHDMPPPYHPQTMEGERLDASCVCNDGSNPRDMHSEVRVASPPADCRRKRSRSHSQDSNAMQELHVFRLQKGVIMSRGVSLQGQEEEGEEREEKLSFNAHLSVLDSVTLSMNSVGGAQYGLQFKDFQFGLHHGLGTNSLHHGLETNGLQLGMGTNSLHHGLETNGLQLGMGTSNLPLVLGTNGLQLGLGTSGSQLGLGTMINSLQKMSLASHSGGDQGTMGAMHHHTGDTRGHLHTDTRGHLHTDTRGHLHTDTRGHLHTDTRGHLHTEDTRGHLHTGDTSGHLNFRTEWSTASVSGIDLFIVIHTYPPPSVCQKFLCYKDNEINLMYHFWLFPDAPLDDNYVRQEALEMGVFEPSGVTPVHQNLRDGGVAFHYMEQRTVCIHKCSFSPENAQLELQRGNRLHMFFSAARSRDKNRTVITYHVVPGNIDVEQQLRVMIGRCSTLSDLVEGLSNDFPEPGATMRALINSLQR